MNELEDNLHDEITAGEKWLARFPSPTPSPQALEQTKQAVRAELTRVSAARSVGRRWAAWHGVVAAAATLAFAVTIGWYSLETPTPSPSKTEALATWWPSDIQEEVTSFARLDDGLSDLEELSVGPGWTENGASLYDALEGALRDESGKDSGDSGALRPPSDDHRAVDTVA